MDPFAGGAAAELEWADHYPAATVFHVRSSHITIPYADGTAQSVGSFVALIEERAQTHAEVQRCRERFTDVKGAIEGAQTAFRQAWRRSEYSQVDYRRASGSVDALSVRSRRAYAQVETECRANPAAVWAPIASGQLHWHSSAHAAWLSKAADGSSWRGWFIFRALPAEIAAEQWQPWTDLVDETEHPFVRWFIGGATNAAFNELDRHVRCASHKVALISELAPELAPQSMRLSDVASGSVCAAHALRTAFRVVTGTRVGVFLPNDARAVVWIEACKRLGAPYTAVAAGTASPSLAERLSDVGTAVLISCRALAETASAAAEALPVGLQVAAVDSADEERGLPRGWHDATALVMPSHAKLVSAGVAEGASTSELSRAHWALLPPHPVESSHPLFVLFTSGSTGKPKGVVHVRDPAIPEPSLNLP
jgi:hypothetical protein